jgi:signal peptidase I
MAENEIKEYGTPEAAEESDAAISRDKVLRISIGTTVPSPDEGRSAISLLTTEDFIFDKEEGGKGEDEKGDAQVDSPEEPDNEAPSEEGDDAALDPDSEGDGTVTDADDGAAKEEVTEGNGDAEFDPVITSEEFPAEDDAQPDADVEDTDKNEALESDVEEDENSDADTEQMTQDAEELSIDDISEEILEPTEGKSKPSPKKEEYDPEHPRFIDTVFDFLELFIFSLAAVLIFTTFFFRHSVVEGGSMENTLLDGEHLIISNMFYTPERGDIVVCEDYSTNLRKPIVKRIIGIGGDHIEIDRDGRVKRNGEELPEDYVFIDIDGLMMDQTLDVIVPEGEVFIMGDHRNNSTDSRNFGTVATDSIIGRVLIRFYPFDKFGTVD